MPQRVKTGLPEGMGSSRLPLSSQTVCVLFSKPKQFLILYPLFIRHRSCCQRIYCIDYRPEITITAGCQGKYQRPVIGTVIGHIAAMILTLIHQLCGPQQAFPRSFIQSKSCFFLSCQHNLKILQCQPFIIKRVLCIASILRKLRFYHLVQHSECISKPPFVLTAPGADEHSRQLRYGMIVFNTAMGVKKVAQNLSIAS